MPLLAGEGMWTGCRRREQSPQTASKQTQTSVPHPQGLNSEVTQMRSEVDSSPESPDAGAEGQHLGFDLVRPGAGK